MDYWAYGLGITSNVEIPAFGTSVSLETIDINFQMGPAPSWADEASSDRGEVVYSPFLPAQTDSKLTITRLLSGKFLELSYDDGTRFVLDGGATHIWAQAGGGLSRHDVFTYLVGPVMGFALHRRQKLALHASAVVVGGAAFAICGEAGSGKSTTAAALALRGNPVLSDDICLLQDLPVRKHVVPGYPRITLWPDSVRQLFASTHELPLVVAGWEKRFLPLDGSVASFTDRPVPLGAIYLLAPRSNEGGAPFIERVSQRQAALALVQNTYMNYLLSKEQRAAEFFAIANLVAGVTCYRVTPHADPSRLRDLASVIESHATKVISKLEPSRSHAVSADVQP
jgi:hypothetical protein